MVKRFSAVIHGRVQGVGFRFFAREMACDLGLVGFVRNTPDGGVEVAAEGEQSALERFLDILRQGPRSAYVARVDVSWEEPTGGHDRFVVRA